MLASGCAVSRAYPTYSMKTGSEKQQQTVTVGFVLVGDSSPSVTDSDVKCLNALCEGIRLTQEIVDTPPNFMHTDGVLDVSLLFCCLLTLVLWCGGADQWKY